MRYPKTIRPVSVLFMLIFLVASGALFALAAPAPVDSVAGGSPARLRLRVKNSSPRAGEATSVWAEFLDRNYVQVQKRRHARYSICCRTAWQCRLLAAPGYRPRGRVVRGHDVHFRNAPGKVVVTASSEALDSDQTVVLVTRQASSFLSQLFETTAYAQQELFELTPTRDEHVR